MPSLRIAGSEWHIASDLLPLPHIIGLVFHVVWVIVFGTLIGVYDVFKTCSGQGGNYVAADAGLLTIFCLLSLCEVAVIVIGFRGAHSAPASTPLLDAGAQYQNSLQQLPAGRK